MPVTGYQDQPHSEQRQGSRFGHPMAGGNNVHRLGDTEQNLPAGGHRAEVPAEQLVDIAGDGVGVVVERQVARTEQGQQVIARVGLVSGGGGVAAVC